MNTPKKPEPFEEMQIKVSFIVKAKYQKLKARMMMDAYFKQQIEWMKGMETSGNNAEYGTYKMHVENFTADVCKSKKHERDIIICQRIQAGDLYMVGKSNSEIAKTLGISKSQAASRVRQWMKANDK